MPKPTALQKTQERGLAISAEEAAAFPWDHTDLLIAQSMLMGNHTPTMIAEDISTEEKRVKKDMIRQRLLDPLRCAWISQEVGKGVESFFMNVVGALYARAMRTGEPAAVKLLHQLYGKWRQKPKEVRHTHAVIDFTALSTDELKKYIAEQKRRLGGNEVIDAEFTESPHGSD